MNLYEILGVKTNATIVEIKNAYRKKAVENHPDKKGGSPEKMAAINHAKDILTDAVKKERYDRTGMDGKQPTFDQRFKQTMDGLLMQIIKEPGNNVDTIDVVGLMKSSIQDAMDDYKKKKKIKDTELTKILSTKERIKSKDKTIQYVLDARIDEYNKVLAKMADEIVYCQECLEFLDKYEYDFEPPTNPSGFTVVSVPR